MKKIHNAFTLLELTIVLIIMSVITVGIMSGTGLINSSRMTTARSLTEKSPVKNIDGLVAWYETTSVDSFNVAEVSDGAIITNWFDINPTSLSSKKNTLTHKTGTVTYVREGINKLPALSFSSQDDPSVSNLELSAFVQGSTAQNTIFVVFKQSTRSDTGNPVRNIIDSHSSNSATLMGYAIKTPNDQLVFNATNEATVNFLNPNQVFMDEKPYILVLYYDREKSKGYLNSIAEMVGNNYVNQTPGDTELSGLTIGSSRDDNNDTRFVGQLSELVIFNRVLKDQERSDVMIYLSKKYNIKVGGIS